MTDSSDGFLPSAGGVLRRLCARKLALVSLIVTLVYLGMAVFAEGYAAWCSARNTEPVYQLRDATRTAVKVGLIASLIATLFGVTLGICAGYFGGTADDIVVWIYSTFASMPSLLFILAFALLVTKGFLLPSMKSVFDSIAHVLRAEPGMLAVYLGIGLTGWVSLCRVVRAEAMRIRETQYVQAARTLGASSFSIVFRHVLPNLMHLVIIYFTMQFAFAIMTEVIVSYLGLGVQFEPSWGVMIADGQERLWRGVWWEVGTATLFMFVLVLCLNILGDALRDALDPSLRNS